MSYPFSLIEYPAKASYREWGEFHGEEFRKEVAELAQIRRELLLARIPGLGPRLKETAEEQWELTKQFAPDLGEELEGICKGSGLRVSDIVILNNYTDFRDMGESDQGCSTIHINRKDTLLAGQTWDMHRSAKNYVCLISTPENRELARPGAIVFSLLGCVGMMGINTEGCLLGVNNLNTLKARSGILWPVLVRKCLWEKNRSSMVNLARHSPVTSGHNYIFADSLGGEHWEITPEAKACASQLIQPEEGETWHTNHCVTSEVGALENKKALSSTTYDRDKLLKEKVKDVDSFDDLYKLLTDHQNYPRSICSHFESGAQDPSFTCGGGIGNLTTMESKFWRGCPLYDKTYQEYSFQLKETKEGKTFVQS